MVCSFSHQSLVDNRYKRSLVKTMLNRAFRLSSTWDLFTTECERLKLMFFNLKYPDSLLNSTITHFVTSVTSRHTIPTPQTDNIHWIVLPFKDQRSADIAKKHLSDFNKIDHILQPVFRSRKLGDVLKVQEPKPPVINQQCVVYNFVRDLCDVDYVGYTSRHLHQRIDKHWFFAIGKHLKNDHQVDTIGDPSSETQGQSVGGGRNGATKVFKNGRINPWVPSLTGPFPNGFANTGS